MIKLGFCREGGEPVTGATGGANKEVDEKIILLSEKISALVQEAETAGCAGNVEQVSTKIGKPN